MADPSRHLRALEHAARDAQRVLETSVSRADETWSDDARGSFDAEYLAAIRADARRLGVELGEIVAAAENALNALQQG
jgi:hypothetical protein